ncbi:MAG: hypothetical protein IIB38_08610 [Candidatus Hydrogenedentes bacterium]|nr:hypothetical protein [Candidatus Hydrogenedentota bacterium]
MFIDDLARIIPYILTEDGDEPEEPDSFSALKRRMNKGKLPALQAVNDLFSVLDQDDSWWSLGFKPRVGMRQRLTHYTDLVYFAGSAKGGYTGMNSDISLTAIGGPVRVVDFESALQNLLTSLFEWLDQLDQALLAHLSERLAGKGILWNPFDEPIPVVKLPDLDNTRPNASHYLYLPMCSRS